MKMKLIASYVLIFVLASCNSKSHVNDDCRMALQLHSKDLLLQEIYDLRYRLRHPLYKLEDIKRYNELLFVLWLSDLDRFNKIYPSLPLYGEDQVKMHKAVLLDNDPLDLKRFGILSMKYDKSHIGIYSNVDEDEELRFLIVENFNDSNRVFSSYEEEVERYADKIRSRIRHVN